MIGTAHITLDPRHRIQREVSELFGKTLPTGGYLHLIATQPVQVLGLLGNDKTGAVAAIWPVVISAPAPVIAGRP